MLIDCKEKFLIKSTKLGSLKGTSELYKIYSNSSEKFHDAALLYQEILTKFCPKDAIKIILINGKIDNLKQNEIENGFINAYLIVANYLILNRFYFSAVHWAKKGMDLFDFFHSKYPQKIIEDLKRNSKDYQNLCKIFEENKSHFANDFYYGHSGYTGLKFAWESDYTPTIHHDNDNLRP
jgi:hypothetical protein